MLPAAEKELSDRFVVHLWPAIPDKERWLVEHAHEISVVATNGHFGIDIDIVRRLPSLRLIAVNGVGVDRIDLAALAATNVRVTNTPDVLTNDVADLAVALLLCVLRKVPAADRFVRSSAWLSGEMPLTRSVSGLQVGILGFGRIGQAIARRLVAFDCQIGYSARHVNDKSPFDYYKSVLHLAGKSEALFVCTPGGPQTAKLVDDRILGALGSKGVLINVSRGSVVDEKALVVRLLDGRLGGAGLDVFADEPNVPEALFSLPNVVLTPHVASATAEARLAMGNLMIANIAAYMENRPLLTEVRTGFSRSVQLTKD